MKKRNVFLILIFIITIVVILAIVNKTELQRIMNGIRAQEITPFSYEIYMGQGEDYTIIITLEDEKGIKQIEYPNAKMILYANGKTKVAIDYEVKKDVNYSFKVTNENGEENIYNILINDEYIDNIIKINVLSETTLGTKANINIWYGQDGKTNQYVIGKENTNWNNYNEEFELTSYDVIENMWSNEDGTITIKARIVDEAGNMIQIEKQINCLDLDIPEKPQITIKTEDEYALLTSNGVVYNGDASIIYDTREDITNYYSIDNGLTWNIYEKEFSTAISGVVLAKSVKNETGLESTSNAEASLKGPYAILGKAYDSNKETAHEFRSGTNVGRYTFGYAYMNIDSSAWNKDITMYYIGYWDSWASSALTFYDNEGKNISSIAIKENTMQNGRKFTIPENAVQMRFSITSPNGTGIPVYIYEIEVGENNR